jgi:hypothetical protein
VANDTQRVEAVAESCPKAPVIAVVSNLAEFAACVSELASSGKGVRWFRGTSMATHSLIPSLYRHPTIKDANDLMELEWELLSEFRHQAPPFAGKLPDPNLELLFLMQHFGVPTRLLDWSENPFIALFFALERALQAGGNDHDAAVWVLDPVELNNRSTSYRESATRIFGAYAPELAGYEPSEYGKRIAMKLPLAIFGIHNSPRIVAQRGAFVMFGRDTTALDLNPALSGDQGVVDKILVKSAFKGQMRKDLSNIGVSDSVVYPDLDGLGREIKNRKGF